MERTLVCLSRDSEIVQYKKAISCKNDFWWPEHESMGKLISKMQSHGMELNPCKYKTSYKITEQCLGNLKL